MIRPSYSFVPALESAEVEQDLQQLLRPGHLPGADLARLIGSLEHRYRVYTTTIPFGLWAPGLAVTNEQRAVTETYLPLNEIRSAFAQLATLSLRFSPSGYPSIFSMQHNWLDVLPCLPPSVAHPNPARIMNLLLRDEGKRRRFFFSVFLPKSYGGGFGRYAEQHVFIKRWIKKRLAEGMTNFRCLDAACGTGEGTYELAEILLEEGISPKAFAIVGTSLQPLEIFAASHAYFLNDTVREKMFRARVAPLFAAGAAGSMRFVQEDLTYPTCDGTYDLILCNGLLGGPLLHDRGGLDTVIRSLAGRLADGGVLLAADRFHAGWKQIMPQETLGEILTKNGLRLMEIAEGIAAIRHFRQQ